MRHLAVFDWNGTLYDDMAATHAATNAALAFFDHPPITLEEEQSLFTFPLIHFYEKVGIGADRYLQHAEKVGRVWIEKYNQEKIKCGLKPGAVSLLSKLHEQNIAIMLLSNNMQYILDEDLARFDLVPYFDVISGNEDPATIVSGLSKQERLESYMRKNRFDPAHTMIVGDSHEEADIAHRLGLFGLSISGGLLSKERLKKEAKDHIIDHLDEVAPLLTQQWQVAL
jgi:phosphoglycolate phosphatase-like HAD superfamily hydrolase